MYQQILIPTDGSDESVAAAQHGIDLAESLGAKVHALYVIESQMSGLPSKSLNQVETMDEMEEYGEKLTARVAEMAEERGLEAETAVRKGKPYEEIVEFADENDVDAIVMGTRGRSGIEDYLIGNVTEKVVRTANVPVVTLRRPKLE